MTNLVPVLTPEQVASMFDCTADTVRERAASGELPGVKIGRDWRFPAAALYDALCKLAVEQAQQRRAGQPSATVMKLPRRKEAPPLP